MRFKEAGSYLLPPFNVFFSLYGVWRIMIFFNLAHSSASSSLAQTYLISSSTVFLQLFFGYPGGLLPSMVSYMVLSRVSSLSLFLTCPYYLSLLLTTTSMWLNSVSICHLLTPHMIQQSQVVSTRSMHTTGMLLFTRRLEISLHFHYAIETLILTALYSYTLPSQSSKFPR